MIKCEKYGVMHVLLSSSSLGRFWEPLPEYVIEGITPIYFIQSNEHYPDRFNDLQKYWIQFNINNKEKTHQVKFLIDQPSWSRLNSKQTIFIQRPVKNNHKIL